MPGGDRTGPMGMGPMTGRAAGYCAGYPVPGYMNPYMGRGPGMAWGRGFRRGGGRGFRRGYGVPVFPGAYPAYGLGMPYVPPFSPAAGSGSPYDPAVDRNQELDMLKQQAEYLTDTLGDIKKRIDELELTATEHTDK